MEETKRNVLQGMEIVESENEESIGGIYLYPGKEYWKGKMMWDM